ncbi:triose-phosphate transporter family-domain-containing protein [Lipomyces arxii]|uniref:triose-phosphate transporter family-domain-containing protein n=1 Tax=Lipomyces arxii TaxID=56418 RepID=UPI0034CE55F8
MQPRLSTTFGTWNESPFSSNDDEGGPEEGIAFNIDDEDPYTSTIAPASRMRLPSTDRILFKKIAINIGFILLWYTFSLSLSLYNKWMFSGKHLDFRFPLFATSVHMVTQTLLAGLVLYAVPKFRPTRESRMPWRTYITHVGSCGIATGADIGLGNMSLRFITLAFYTMVKSSNLVFVLLFAFIFKLERPNLKLIGIIGIMTAGVVMMVASETEFVLIGFILVLIAAMLSGFRWSLTQILLKRNEATSNPFATIFYLAPVMCVTLLLLAIPIEGVRNFVQSPVWVEESWEMWFLILVAPGMIAFMMTAAEFFLLHRTTVVTLSIVGIFKEVVTIGASAGVFGDQLTPVNVSGLIVTLIAIGVYNYIRIRGMREKIQEERSMGGMASADDGPGLAYAPVPAGDELEMTRMGKYSSRASPSDVEGFYDVAEVEEASAKKV